jgi:hypothetical protein
MIPMGFSSARHWVQSVHDTKGLFGGEASTGVVGFWMPLNPWLSLVPLVSLFKRDRAVLRFEDQVVMLGDLNQVIAVGTIVDVQREDGWKCSLLKFKGKRMWVAGKPLMGLDSFFA